MPPNSILEYLIIALALVAGAAAFFGVRHLIRGLVRHLGKLQGQMDMTRDDHNLWAARIQQEVADLRNQIHDSSSQTKTALDDVAAGVRTAASVGPTLTARADELNSGIGHLAAREDEISAAITNLSTAFDLHTRRPGPPVFLDPTAWQALSAADLLKIAESLAILRPLVSYPDWHTDAELHNGDLGYRLRRWLWQYFHDRRNEDAITVHWHDDTRLRVFLGNDISAQVYVAGCWEPNEFAFLDRVLRPGMTFLDIGANDGMYAVFAAKRVGPSGTVWAFEPSPRELDRLRLNLELNQLAAQVFPVALGDTAADVELLVAGYEHEGHNTLGAFAYEGVTGTREKVAMRRLDDIVAENRPARIDVLKLDVEGAEWRVLTGSLETLRRYRPILLFEVSEGSLRNQGASGAALLDLVRAQNYALFAFDRATGLVVPASPGMASDNFVGVPEGASLPDAVRSPWPYRP
jgi:FkbM family methyltransferase